MEEDIKILEEYIKTMQNDAHRKSIKRAILERKTEIEIIKSEEQKALENLIKAYKELEEKNKENLQTLFNYEDTLEHYEYKIFEELDDYIKLEEIAKLDEIGIKGVKYIKKDKLKENYIPKSLMKEKIQELKNMRDTTIVAEAFNILHGEIQVLEELLKGEEK